MVYCTGEDHRPLSARPDSPSAAQKQSPPSKASGLRDDTQLRKSASDSCIRLGNVAHAEKVKQRSLYLKNLNRQLGTLLSGTYSASIVLRRCISDCKRQAGAVKASLAVCSKRIELRAQRPLEESGQDDFDKALLQERSLYIAAQEDLGIQLEIGREILKPLEASRRDMQVVRLRIHTDRTGCAEKLVMTTTGLLEKAERHCKDCNSFLEDVQAEMQRALERTCGRMKRHIRCSMDSRLLIENEMLETRKTISETELQLEKTVKELQIAFASPERSMVTDGDGMNDKLSANTGVVGLLRSKIKSAAYTGPGGRNLSLIFSRFDRDKSGELDEDEIRVAFRTACKISPDVISDIDIVALCELLDEDSSGTVSIAELVDFLLADVNVEQLQNQIQLAESTLARLAPLLEQTTFDFRSKTMVWRINEACSKVTPIKALELEGPPSKPRKSSSVFMPLQSRVDPIAAKARATALCEQASADGSSPAGASKVREKLCDAVASAQLQTSMAELPPELAVVASKVAQTMSAAAACGQLQPALEQAMALSPEMAAVTSKVSLTLSEAVGSGRLRAALEEALPMSEALDAMVAERWALKEARDAKDKSGNAKTRKKSKKDKDKKQKYGDEDTDSDTASSSSSDSDDNKKNKKKHKRKKAKSGKRKQDSDSSGESDSDDASTKRKHKKVQKKSKKKDKSESDSDTNYDMKPKSKKKVTKKELLASNASIDVRADDCSIAMHHAVSGKTCKPNKAEVVIPKQFPEPTILTRALAKKSGAGSSQKHPLSSNSFLGSVQPLASSSKTNRPQSRSRARSTPPNPYRSGKCNPSTLHRARNAQRMETNSIGCRTKAHTPFECYVEGWMDKDDNYRKTLQQALHTGTGTSAVVSILSGLQVSITSQAATLVS